MTEGIYDLRTGSQVEQHDTREGEFDSAIAEFDKFLSTQ